MIVVGENCRNGKGGIGGGVVDVYGEEVGGGVGEGEEEGAGVAGKVRV